MKRKMQLGLVVPLVLVATARGAIVDRAAVTVGAKVITESEIVRRIRLTAFQNGQIPDLSPASRRDAARRLIDIKLVEREMDVGHYDRTPPMVADALVASFTAEHYRSNADALRLALAAVSLTPDDLKEEFAEQTDLLSFLGLRFRPAVEVGDAEIERYYKDHFLPKEASPSLKPGEAPPPEPLPLGDVRAKIAETLADQHADADLEAWLKDQREKARIVYLVKELQ